MKARKKKAETSCWDAPIYPVNETRRKKSRNALLGSGPIARDADDSQRARYSGRAFHLRPRSVEVFFSRV